MSNIQAEEKTQYSKVLSGLFCSNSIIALSILCLLNNLTLDMYTAMVLIKIVIPASICFWFLGFVIGSILDRCDKKLTSIVKQKEEQAYEIPSIFSAPPENNSLDDVI